ncbi:MAG TPA: hypothetical protein PK668_16700 [Myxococcota bacterium]|nr:hypothetical protein [Myxococcota bacterium]HRY94798.1 hypothetical protein [Myxococcota bacterium]HSA21940.1 hypothetical protein [Myxococcota bacterium]
MTSPHATRPLSGLAAALLLLAGGAAAQPVLDGLDLAADLAGPVRVEAGRLESDQGGRHLLLRGGVQVHAQDLELAAEWMEVWTEEERATLAGGVRIRRRGSALVAERLELDRRHARALLFRATVLVKEVPPRDLPGSCPPAAVLVADGRNQLRLQALRWRREGGRWRLEEARLTACDCGPDEAPTWELWASEADVVPDERAWLRWPVLALKGVPAFALPLAYLPLGERRTGLLVPELNYSGRDGVVLGESLFVTLGEHADTTLSLDWFQERGLRERLELRAAPWRRVWLEARVAHIADDKAEAEAALGRRAGRQRVWGELAAWADLPRRVDVRAALRLYGDSDIPRDFASDLLGRAMDQAPSALALAWRTDHTQLGLDVGFRQDLRAGAVPLFGADDEALRARLGMDPVGDEIQRLGALRFDLLPWRPAGDWPLLVALSAELANLSSLQAAWRDWGPDGTPDPRELAWAGAPPGDRGLDDGPGGEGDGALGPGELRRAVRLWLEPELRVPWRPLDGLLLEARLSHRQLVYLPHGALAPAPSTRGTTYGGLRLQADLARGYGEGEERLGHLLSPRVELAGAWRGLSSGGPWQSLDHEDRLVADAAQLLAGLGTGLFLRRGGGFQRFLGLEILQAVDLRSPGLGQAMASLGLDLDPARLRLGLGVDWEAPRLAEVDGGLSLRDPRGDVLMATYLYLPSSPDAAGLPLPLSERTQREIGLLFGGAPEPWRGLGDSLHVLQLDARLEIAWGLWASGSLHLNLRDVEPTWYGGGLGYRSDCRCFAVSASVRMLAGQELPDVFFFLDLGLLGSGGGGTKAMF